MECTTIESSKETVFIDRNRTNTRVKARNQGSETRAWTEEPIHPRPEETADQEEEARLGDSRPGWGAIGQAGGQ